MTIVICAKGYPGSYKKDIKKNNIKKINFKKKNFIYHAGTKIINNKIKSSGGRVLNVSSIGNSFFQIRKKIIHNIKMLKIKDSFYRSDIGWKVIKKNENN